MKELNLLERSIVSPFINEEDKETIAIYPGAFKPPHRGHLSVVEKTNAVADKTIILISNSPREDVEAEESLKIWELYTKDMPNVEVKISERFSPVAEAYSLFKHNPEKNFVMAIGKGEIDRLNSLTRYDNAKPFDAGTFEDLSATRLRKAIREGNMEIIQKFIPENISVEEYLSAFDQAPINEDQYPENFLQDSITSFAQYMEDSGMQIAPPPRVEFVNDDVENAENLLGKTAYYDPQENVIVLYTLGRHPKDILRSFAHEMIHHIQNLEGRLGNITTTNTNEDDYLDQIEREAYEHGNMTFRNWTDSILNDESINEIEADLGKTLVPFLKDIVDQLKKLNANSEDSEDDIEGLDKSIDYLASALTGKSAFDINIDQTYLGRLASPGEDKIKENNFKLSELKDIIKSVNEDVVSNSEIEDLIAKAVKKPSSEVDLDAIEKDKELKEVSTGVATILALPVLLELASKLSNKIYRKLGLTPEEAKLYKSKKKEISDIKKKHNISKIFDININDTPEQKTAKQEIQKIEKFIGEKFPSFVGDILHFAGHKFHQGYTYPIRLLLKGAAFFVPSGKGYKIKDPKFREKVANVVYAAIMAYIAGDGIISNLKNFSGVKEAYTAVVEATEGGASIAKVIESGLEAIGAIGELNTK